MTEKQQGEAPKDHNKTGRSRVWVRDEMPAVTRIVAGYRKRDGDAHVNECWRRGMAGEPGWFFAREGPIAIGTPWELDAPDVLSVAALAAQFNGAALVMLRPKGGRHG